MDAFTDSGELYSIRNQFYTNQHHRVQNYQLDLFLTPHQLKVLEFQIRSMIALQQDASKLIEEGKTRFPDNEGFFQLLEAYDDLSLFGTDKLTYFDDVKLAEFELQAVLTAIYYVRYEKDYDQAIQLLEEYISKGTPEFEPYLVLIQLYLVKLEFSAALATFDRLKKFNASDDIIYLVVELWINLLRGETENITNAFYFFDELLLTDFEDDNQLKFQVLNVLFVLTLQLQHYPEAQELLVQINELNPMDNGDFIANQITYDYLVNRGANVHDLQQQLHRISPEHAYLRLLAEKNQAFDEIVVKYN